MIIDQEIILQNYNENTARVDLARGQLIGTDVIKCLTTLSTALLLYALYKKQEAKVELWKRHYRIPKSATVFNTCRKMLVPFLVELLVCAFHVPPGVHTKILRVAEWQGFAVSMQNATSYPSDLASCPPGETLQKNGCFVITK